jgi:hypothetical protein
MRGKRENPRAWLSLAAASCVQIEGETSSLVQICSSTHQSVELPSSSPSHCRRAIATARCSSASSTTTLSFSPVYYVYSCAVLNSPSVRMFMCIFIMSLVLKLSVSYKYTMLLFLVLLFSESIRISLNCFYFQQCLHTPDHLCMHLQHSTALFRMGACHRGRMAPPATTTGSLRGFLRDAGRRLPCGIGSPR